MKEAFTMQSGHRAISRDYARRSLDILSGKAAPAMILFTTEKAGLMQLHRTPNEKDADLCLSCIRTENDP